MTESRDAAIREAKRYVREVVRNDWAFEQSPDAGTPSVASPETPDQEVLEWRLREYDSSGSELEPQASPAIGATSQPHPGYDASDLSSPLATPLGDDSERRRKRRRQMEDEMRWNGGLRTWVERRDAWTGALTKDEIRARKLAKQAQASSSDNHDQGLQRQSASIPAASPPLSASSFNSQTDLALRTEASLSIADDQQQQQQQQQQQLQHPASHGEEPSTAAEQPPPAPPAHHASSPSTDTMITEPEPTTTTTTPRTNTPKSPSSPKVVVQGLTPTVPINLADVTKAMVQGWKADGQWPPKPANTNLVLQDDATVPRKPEDQFQAATAAGAGDAKPPSSPESKRRSGVASAVRKVFHFSGFHPHHPFHRRGSSSQQNEGAGAGGEGGVGI
ncbi:hypothetical protein BO70DRAFT_389017 [Aspergillus heteromorphus CBS 117.55]|uniref:Gag1-like clamp domain-containing protein n=1 Tax=Aspergillus heteromorphus CBS 117.55 TaxID=1448321 RepID=A0A317VLF3_9EURO|nr:uncharacterized protein BO70DRAFT_389017 [Aspergillus heteromorphus CBS 117.55]PWY74399.1 hypothetical protein BO70DRAFT_389017 [Aspergillus heteromorphus CBS 117.55]